MNASKAVRTALMLANISQAELARIWGVSPQAMNNKLRLNRWTGDDLARIAALTGGQLAFLFPDGNRVIIQNEEEEKSEPEEQLVKNLVEEFGED